MCGSTTPQFKKMKRHDSLANNVHSGKKKILTMLSARHPKIGNHRHENHTMINCNSLAEYTAAAWTSKSKCKKDLTRAGKTLAGRCWATEMSSTRCFPLQKQELPRPPNLEGCKMQIFCEFCQQEKCRHQSSPGLRNQRGPHRRIGNEKASIALGCVQVQCKFHWFGSTTSCRTTSWFTYLKTLRFGGGLKPKIFS